MLKLTAKIGSVDMDGFLGRDYHPLASDSGSEVEVRTIALSRFNPEPVNAFDIITAVTKDGRVVEFVEFEVESIVGVVVNDDVEGDDDAR